MDFSVKIEGLDKLQNASDALTKAVGQELLIALDASGRKVVDEAKRSILQGQKTGRIYKRRTVVHRASAPGEAPASDTGRLVNSITSEVIRNAFTAVISAGKGIAKYAVFLEFGTHNIAPRPFFFPAFEKSKAWIQERLNQSVNRAIARTTKKK